MRPVSELFYPPGEFTILQPATIADIAHAEKILRVKLPEAYTRLVAQQNGGYLRFCHLPKQSPPADDGGFFRRTWEIRDIFGLQPGNDRCITANAELAREEWGLAKGLVPFEGDGHTWLCFDYRKVGPAGEPSITYADVECDREEPVCASFQILLDGLILTDYRFWFAIDDAAVAGKIPALLKALGCTPGRHGHKGTWDWPPYHGSLEQDKPAYLTFAHKGTEERHWLLSRSAATPLLSLDVCEKDQSLALARLHAALGAGCPLVLVPYGRGEMSGQP